MAKDWSKIDWRYDDEGYVLCPDCCVGMTRESRDNPYNHAPDCDYIKDTQSGKEEDK